MTTLSELNERGGCTEIDFKRSFAILADAAIDGQASLLMMCEGFKHRGRPRTWWQMYSQFNGSSKVKRRVQKILLRQIDVWERCGDE
jgi:hypothetical protein